MRAALLRGSQHTRLGAIATVAEGRLAIAMSRGGASKVYPHTDPNEDAALFAEGSFGLLVAVADGHSGHEGAEAALERLLDGHAERWTEEEVLPIAGWHERVLEALVDVNAAVRGVPGAAGRHSPCTTLALAVARTGQGLLVVASIGDSHVFRAGTADVTELTLRDPRPVAFLGYRAETGATLTEKALVETASLEGTRALVLVTDGISEAGVGVPDPAAAVADAVERAARASPPLRARDSARTLVETALTAHKRNLSGDNVATAVAWLAS